MMGTPECKGPTFVDHECDVLVVGGGPAGATCGALLAQRGFAVVVCERERFPRFHVGESLLPRGNKVLEQLGLMQRCQSMGWTSKPGASFLFEKARAACTKNPSENIAAEWNEPAETAFSSISFAEAMGGGEPTAFQVPRAEFDALLLSRASELGAKVIENCQVRSVEFDEQGATAAIQSKDVCRESVRARFVVDASGQSGFLAKRFGLREVDASLKNLACFAHFSNWRWPGAVEPGNIQVISLRDLGWVWVIPLTEERVSVGLVEPSAHAGVGHDFVRHFEETLSATDLLKWQSGSARRVTKVVRLADFSYRAKNYAGDRWLLVGDAGSFLDPVFSTGVYLALGSGSEAAHAITTWLNKGRHDGPDGHDGSQTLRRFAATQRKRYQFYRRFVLKFYRPGMRDLLCQPREALGLMSALSSVLAGDWQPPWKVRWRLEAFYLLAALQERVDLVQRLHRR